jgi:hypothetical protein
MIYCIMKTGKALSIPAADMLFKAAQKMVKQDKRRLTVTHDDCQGYITTDFEDARIGSICGFKFVGEVITPKGETKVEFLVRSSDLETVKEVEWVDLREKTKVRQKSDSHKWN